MYSLVYVSRAVTALNDVELELLLGTSRASNASEGLTGLLLHVVGYGPDGEGAFVQLLEGGQAAVQSTFDRILVDELHHGITVVTEGPAPTRRFASWAMRLEEISAQDFSGPDDAERLLAKFG
ncbi:BLUF domain-containing protein [Spongisporangium articulatum]|uniref:BLUF domain-containing protein n=1 Tax=Spongisporangium articulatum TaxID=3362603 RepID=A0ABW8AU02_9ACTN